MKQTQITKSKRRGRGDGDLEPLTSPSGKPINYL